MDKMIVDEWLRFAENDLAVVRILSNHYAQPYRNVIAHFKNHVSCR
jgi:hypothetical protein